MKVGGRAVGYGESVFIIAEAGVNHNGDLDVAKRLIDVAVAAGADAVKFQTFKAEELVTDKAIMAEYQKENLGTDMSQINMLKKYELKYDIFKCLKDYCDQKDILFMSTAHTKSAMRYLDEFVPCFKVGSGDLTNLPYLEKIAAVGKPIILSTGMANIDEIVEAIQTIKERGNDKIILLHCTTNYPCDPTEVNMKALIAIQKLGCLVGYSDHTTGNEAAIMAVAMGACVVEKHITLDNNMEGPDHKASMNPEEFELFVKAIRYAEKCLGSGIKEPTASERSIMAQVRKSIVAAVDINRDQIIDVDMLAIKRPGYGIQPKQISVVCGRKALIDIKKNTLLTEDMIQ